MIGLRRSGWRRSVDHDRRSLRELGQIRVDQSPRAHGAYPRGVSEPAPAHRNVNSPLDHELGGPGEITRHVQGKFEDALYGRAEEYREWLDYVEAPASIDAASKVSS